ncbi:MAG: hypothetical protein SGCHY_000924 [Lobulomycetales sp.]
MLSVSAKTTVIIISNVVFWTLTLLYFRSRMQGASAAIFSSFQADKTKCSQMVGEHLPMGKHYLVDFYDADASALKYLETSQAKGTVASFIAKAGMTLLGSSSHLFPCGGITAVWLLSESHVSIHTWPENNFVAIDVYTCGPGDPSRIVNQFEKLLRPGRVVKTFVNRGDRNHDVQTVGAVPVPSHKMIKQDTNALSTTVKYPTDLTIPVGKNAAGKTVAHICINGDDEKDNCIMLKNSVILADQRSKYQRLEIVDTDLFGRCMLLEHVVQFCSSDNAIYTSELIDRVFTALDTGAPAITAGTRQPASVFMVGGGDGWVASSILDRYAYLVKDITAVDIDHTVTELTQKFFKPVGVANSFHDKRVNWIYADAGKYLKGYANAKPGSMDVVIIDCTDHTAGAAKVLYTDQFYSDLYKLLKPGGRMVQQMNTESQSYVRFYTAVEKTWYNAGFRNLNKWKRYIPSFLGESVFWMASKPLH